MARPKIKDRLLSNPNVFYDYVIHDDLRPDQVAYLYYDDPQMLWLIFLANNITSYYSKDAIELLKVSEIIINDPKSFEEIKDTYLKINNLLNKADKYSENLKISEGYISELKLYLQDYMTTDIAPKIINQIEIIQNALENKNPETIAKVTIETQAFIQFEIIDYEERIAEEKRKEKEKLAEEKR